MTVRVLRRAGWTFIAGGVVILLYLVYSLFFTGMGTRAAQASLLEEWEAEVGQIGAPGLEPWNLEVRDVAATDVLPGGTAAVAGSQPAPVEPGEAVAVLQFERPGSGDAIVHSEPLFVIEGVGLVDLRSGPGHYPETAMPGQPGNFAVAGHRTTYDAPFFNLDQLQPGDLIWVTDRNGQRWRYEVAAQRIVPPSATDVLQPDPLQTGAPTLTLTTCHPRFSNQQRMIVHATLA